MRHYSLRWHCIFAACNGSGDLEISRLGTSGNSAPGNDILGHSTSDINKNTPVKTEGIALP